ncbi:MAG: undecaprenyl/decaprenyl-phosphate alpha-N-acetylglucosaminyl 1-phosphate transferase [Planctomycetes bacterium]|nr:undecaprenyl/decaprenyl-phosphate alpha-N-acetylglucosaminyl 1-phosphate transferase [Planctomycetota bacterium]
MNATSTILFALGAILPAGLISWMVAHLMRRFAIRLGLLDHPSARKVHSSPTPLGGGVAIWAGVVGPFLAGHLGLLLLGWNVIPESVVPDFVAPHLQGLASRLPSLWALLGLGTVLMVLGLTDDRRGLDWRPRLAIEFLVAALALTVPQVRLTAFIAVPWLTWALSVLWIVALINSFNMLDNMDGLSSGVAAITSSMLAGFLIIAPMDSDQQPQLFVAGFLLVLVGGLLGFLIHNRPPARIFMGDAGSYFIGFCVAITTLLATYTGYNSTQQHAILAPLCVMAVPLYDMTTVIWIRLRSGRSPFQADKCHFSHRLVELGMTKVQAVLTIYLTTATCGIGAILLRRVDTMGAILVVLLILCVLALIAILEASALRKPKS